jgi:hypothetical protein
MFNVKGCVIKRFEIMISNIAVHHIYIDVNGDLYLSKLQSSANE